MTKNSEIVIDDLIKRIYRSYVEIKVGEFREIDRDILLKDIGLLYTSIKELFPSKESSLIELELENTTHPIIPIDLPMDLDKDPLHDALLHSDYSVEEIEQSSEKKPVVMEHNSLPENLSKFESEKALDTTKDLIDKKSDNTSSPILKGFQTIHDDSKTIQKDFGRIPKIDETKIESHSILTTEEPVNIDTAVQQTQGSEQEKKNTSNIIDFLHHEENKISRDIYSFLDLNTRIGLVELFFKGNSLELTECLVKLNKLDSREECLTIINKFATKFGVSEKEDIYKQLVNLVDRKLNNWS